MRTPAHVAYLMAGVVAIPAIGMAALGNTGSAAFFGVVVLILVLIGRVVPDDTEGCLR